MRLRWEILGPFGEEPQVAPQRSCLGECCSWCWTACPGDCVCQRSLPWRGCEAGADAVSGVTERPEPDLELLRTGAGRRGLAALMELRTGLREGPPTFPDMAMLVAAITQEAPPGLARAHRYWRAAAESHGPGEQRLSHADDHQPH